MHTPGVSTKPWGDPHKAKVLVIGHDPRLKESDTLANYAFFADYHFNPKPSNNRELAKYELAEALFTCIRDLTGGRISDEKLLVTNLCNEALDHPAGRKTVYIPKQKAEKGLKETRAQLTGSNVKLIFAMSQQVNYWLQMLGFYPASVSFVEASKPKEAGLKSRPQYYEPSRPRAFKEICGKRFVADGKYHLFPILHVKAYPLKGAFLTYDEDYAHCRLEVGKTITALRLG